MADLFLHSKKGAATKGVSTVYTYGKPVENDHFTFIDILKKHKTSVSANGLTAGNRIICRFVRL